MIEAEAAADLKNYAEPTGGINEGPFDKRARWNTSSHLIT